MARSQLLKEDWNKMVLIWTEEVEHKDGSIEEVEHAIKAQAEVCGRCDGRGKHDHPAFSNGITAEEWDRDWDEDSREEYVNGRYDVPCEVCGGKRVELIMHDSTENDPVVKRLHKMLDEESRYLAEQRAEQRMGY